jgi:para-nitrobenzyl esterase
MLPIALHTFLPGLLCLLLLAGCSEPDSTAPPSADPATRVTTPQGDFVGFRSESGVHAWLGLPYATPPVDALRWRAPRPPEPHSGIREALVPGAACTQIGSPLGGAPPEAEGRLWGSEDCLHLNIWAPAGEREDLPVMVWVHGGGNTVGHGAFQNGTALAARHRVIIVSVNYRLGPFGWFHHPALTGDSPEDASGNYGTLDLIRALEWVRDSIPAFGGDPRAITLFGESAGATNIASLVVSPLAHGLFRGAIMQSGSTGSATVAEASHYRDHPDAPGATSSSREVLLRAVGGTECDRRCARSRIESMSLAEQETVLRGLDAPALFDLYAEDSGLLGPDVPALIRDGRVLPRREFVELFGDADASAAVPMMLGTNRDEPKIFMVFDPEHVFRIAGIPVWRREPRMYELHAEYGALAWKLRGVEEPARRLAASSVPVWTYRWDWDEQGSLATIDLSTLIGAAHGLEIPFVFGHFDLGPQTSLLFHEDNAEARIALSERMMAYWAAFARDLDPGRGADGLGPLWHPRDPTAGHSFIRLDTGADGIAMDDGQLTLERLLQRLRQDDRFRSNAERCRILESGFRSTEDPLLERTADRLECTES